MSKKALTVTANTPAAKTYGTTVTFAGTEFTTSGLVNGNTVTSVTLTSSGAAATAAVGPYPIVPSAAVGTGLANYTITYVNGTLTVTGRAITVTADAQSKTVGASDPVLAYQITSGSLANGDTFSGSLTRVAGESAGTYTIQQGTLALSSSYTLTYVSGVFTINNPVPTTTSISPTSKNVGDLGFSMTVNGTNFVPGSVVQFAGSSRTTTYVSATQLTAAILTSDLTTAGTSNITVFNPAPGGGTSNAQTFTTTPLTVVSINCSVSCAATSAATVAWTVTFSTSVSGVNASAFSLAASGLSGAYIATVTGSGTTWTVTANTGIGAGTLGLNQTGPGSVVPTLSGTFTGQVYTISATPALAEYRMDEARWNGTANEVVDSSGSGNHAVAVNGVSTTGGSASEAILGNPGTCRYGKFNGGYVQTPLPNLTTDFTITAWIRTTDKTAIGQRILIDDEGTAPATGYGFSFNDAGAGVLRFFSRGITSNVILDSTYPIANNTWYFVAAVADITNKKRTIYVFDAAGTWLNTTTEAAWASGTWGTDGGPVSIGGETIASGEAALHFVGNLDEVRVYQKVLSQAALTAIATQTHACAFTGPDHYELSLPTSSITCLPTTATVTACADTSSPCTNPFAAASGTTATLAATAGSTLGATTLTFGVNGIASTTLSYPAAADGTAVAVTLSGEQIAANSLRQCCPDGTSCVVASSCSTTFRTAGFIFSSTKDIVTVPPIPTPQVAGTSSGTYYLRAVKTVDKSSHTCGAAFSGANTVNFAYECNNPTSCSGSNLMSVNGGSATTIARNDNGSVSSYLPVNMTFDATGNAPFTLNYSDVGLVTLWVNKTMNSAVLTGSSNAFVVKPGGFVLSGIPAATDATGAKFVKAGEAFSATVTATTTPASGALTTPNYGKEIAPEGVKLTNALVTGLGLTDNPALGGSFGSFTNGVATGTAFTWNEVGIIKLTPSVGDGDYLGAGDITGTTSGNVGRFYAGKFELSGGSIANRTDIAGCAAGCGPFTYMGEQMSSVFTLTAKAVDGTTTLLNYNWSATPANQFAKLNPLAAVTTGTGGPLGMGAVDTAAPRTPFTPCGVTPAHPCLTPAPATAGSFTSGVANVTVPFTIYRDNATLAGPYALLDIGVAPLDSDGTIMAAYDRDTVNVVAGTANHTLVGQTKTRYGRLKMQNIFGSEKLPLVIPLQAQYWNGSYFINNADDNKTGLSVPASGTAPPTGVPNLYFYPVTGTSKNQLSSSNTTASLGTPSLAAGGVDTLAFSAPGASHPGWVDIILQVPTYLQGQWGNCMGQTNNGALYDDHPCARATFGVYGAKSPIIYRRENY